MFSESAKRNVMVIINTNCFWCFEKFKINKTRTALRISSNTNGYGAIFSIGMSIIGTISVAMQMKKITGKLSFFSDMALI